MSCHRMDGRGLLSAIEKSHRVEESVVECRIEESHKGDCQSCIELNLVLWSRLSECGTVEWHSVRVEYSAVQQSSVQDRSGIEWSTVACPTLKWHTVFCCILS